MAVATTLILSAACGLNPKKSCSVVHEQDDLCQARESKLDQGCLAGIVVPDKDGMSTKLDKTSSHHESCRCKLAIGIFSSLSRVQTIATSCQHLWPANALLRFLGQTMCGVKITPRFLSGSWTELQPHFFSHKIIEEQHLALKQVW